MAALSFPIRPTHMRMAQMHAGEARAPSSYGDAHAHAHASFAPAPGPATPRRAQADSNGGPAYRAQPYQQLQQQQQQQQEQSPHRDGPATQRPGGGGGGGAVPPVPLSHRPPLVQYARQGAGSGHNSHPATPVRAQVPFGGVTAVAAAAMSATTAAAASDASALPVPSAEHVQAFAQLLQGPGAGYGARYGAASPVAAGASPVPATPTRRHQRHSTDALLMQMQMQREQQAQQQQQYQQQQAQPQQVHPYPYPLPVSSGGGESMIGAGISFDFDDFAPLPDDDERKGDTERTPSKPTHTSRGSYSARGAASTSMHSQNQSQSQSATPRGASSQRNGVAPRAAVPNIGLPLSFPDPLQLPQPSPSTRSPPDSPADSSGDTVDRWNAASSEHAHTDRDREDEAHKKPLTVVVSSPLPRHEQQPLYQSSTPPRRASPDLLGGEKVTGAGAGSGSVPGSPARPLHARHMSTPDRPVRALPLGSPSASPPGSARVHPAHAFPLRAGNMSPQQAQQQQQQQAPLSARSSSGVHHGDRYSLAMEPYNPSTPSSSTGGAATPSGPARTGVHGRNPSDAPGPMRHLQPQPNTPGGSASGSQSSRRPHPSSSSGAGQAQPQQQQQQQYQAQRPLRNVSFASEGELVRYDDAPAPLLSAARLARLNRVMLLPNGQPRPILRYYSPSSSASASPSPSPIPSPRTMGRSTPSSHHQHQQQHQQRPAARLSSFHSTLQLESLCVHSVRRGAPLVKYDSQGRPGTRWFFVEETESEHRLAWENVKARPGENSNGLDSPFEQANSAPNSPPNGAAGGPTLKRRGSTSTSLPFFSIGRFKFNQDRSRSLIDVTALHYGPYWSDNFALALQRHDGASGGGGNGTSSGAGGASPHVHPWLCFSIHFQDRTIDLVAPDEGVLTRWFLGLQALAPHSVFHLSRGALLWQRLVMKINGRGLDSVRTLMLDMHPEHHLHQQRKQQQQGGQRSGARSASSHRSPPALARASSLSNLPLPLPLSHRRSHTALAAPLVLTKKSVKKKAPYVPLLCVGVRSN